MAELLGQNSQITFAWGNVKIQQWEYDEITHVEPSTGSGDGDDAKHVGGTVTRRWSVAGLVKDGTPDFSTKEGTIKIDLTGDNSKTISVNCVMKRQRIRGNWIGGGKITYQGIAIADGAPTIAGGP